MVANRGAMLTEPHSIKQWEDGVAWWLETDAETLLLTGPAINAPTASLMRYRSQFSSRRPGTLVLRRDQAAPYWGQAGVSPA